MTVTNTNTSDTNETRKTQNIDEGLNEEGVWSLSGGVQTLLAEGPAFDRNGRGRAEGKAARRRRRYRDFPRARMNGHGRRGRGRENDGR